MSNLKPLELFSLIIIMSIASFVGIGFNVALNISGQDTYLAIIIAFLLGIPSILGFILIFNYEKELSLNFKLQKLFGEVLGTIINYILIIVAFIIGITYMYNLINFTLNHYLDNTPIFIIGLIYLLLIVYTNFKGLTTISRMTFILLIINFILFMFPLFNLMPKTNIDNLKPLLTNNFNNILKSAFNIVLLTINNIFILLIIPQKRFKNTKKINKYIILAYIISIIILFFISFITLNILGPRLSLFYQDPEYIVLKQVNLFNFLNRIENIISMQWLNGLYISITMIIYYISNSIKKDNNKKIIPVLAGTIVFILSMVIFKNNTIFYNFIINILPQIRLIAYILFIIICITILIKKKKNNDKSLF